MSGNLNPDSVHDAVRVIVDCQGEIIGGVEPHPVFPSDEGDLPESA
ncbi:hypothetical protein [Methanospirillum lacunae]|nr:hypothetical protein [Methanospirillum lacunae]